LIASIVERELFFDKVEFEHKNGEILLIDKKEDGYSKYFPIIKQSKQRATNTNSRDG
jgi:hypothetical protein